MSEEVESAIIIKTQEALQKYMKKPPLTEKLLKKPPFRYLHDIVCTIIRETGFLGGVFSTTEMDSINIKDKEAKISFLNKLIVAVQTATGQKVNARPAKIVAGLEVKKTLELLQLIGKAVDEKVVAKEDVKENLLNSDSKLPERDTDTTTCKDKENNLINESQTTTKTAAKKSQKKYDKKSPVTSKSSIVKEASEENLEKSNESVTNRNKNEKKIKKPELSDGTNSHKNVEKTKQQNKKKAIDMDLKEQKKVVTRIKEAPKADKPDKKSKETVTVANDFKNISSDGKNQMPVIKHVAEKRNIPNKSVVVRKSSIKKNNSQNDVTAIKNLESVISEKMVSSQRTTTVAESKTLDVVNNERIQKPASDLSTTENPTTINEAGENEINKHEYTVKNSDRIVNELKKPEKLDQEQEPIIVRRPSSARFGSRKLHQGDVKENTGSDMAGLSDGSEKMLLKNKIPTSIKPGSASRPPSARPGAPRIRDRGETAETENTVITENSVHVIEERGPDRITDEKDSFIVIESDSLPVLTNESEKIDDTHQGQLVHQILRTQKQLHGGLNADSMSKKHLKIERENDKRLGSDVVLKEIEKIRESIQILTSAANPLGKLFDFLQEDVDEMLKELQHWKIINDKLHKRQTVELNAGKVLLQPLLKQLTDIENDIRDEYLQIGNIKTTILNNDRKIFRLTCSDFVKTRIT